MKYLSLCFILFLCLTSSNLSAQTPKQIEADLLKSFKRIGYWYLKTNDTTDAALAANDSLENANDVFAKKLKHYTEKFPSTITYPFASLQKESLDISTSSDGLFRIYSWDTWTGGTMLAFENAFQYKSDNKVISIIDTAKHEDDYVYSYKKIYTLKVNNKSYYLVTYIGAYSNQAAGCGIKVFDIENWKLDN
ncbi:MAG: hypothetical protein ACTHJ8_15365, partial [Mucilaginibacter sp.]